MFFRHSTKSTEADVTASVDRTRGALGAFGALGSWGSGEVRKLPWPQFAGRVNQAHIGRQAAPRLVALHQAATR